MRDNVHNTKTESWKRLRRTIDTGGFNNKSMRVEAAIRESDEGSKLKHVDLARGSSTKLRSEAQIDRLIDFLKDVKGEL